MTATTKLEWDDCDQKPTAGVIHGPRREDVEHILEHLGRCQKGFVILSVTDQRYIQTIFRTSGRPRDGFDVEYQAGSTGRHYSYLVEVGHLDIRAVRQLFLAYHDDPSCVRSLGRWEKMSLG